MEFQWVVKPSHKKIYRDFIDRYKDHPFVRGRVASNIEHVDVAISKDIFWKVLLGCFFTTQQRSGKGSHVERFLASGDALLDVNHCLGLGNLRNVAEKALAKNGLRRSERIANEIDHAATQINVVGWATIRSQLDTIASYTTARKERLVARFLQERFLGLGPKQSRNLIQWMGLSKYEIPLDSRMVKVLRELKFPVPLSPTALADENYYCFIEDAIQLLMARIDVYPCVFDACAFASFEKDA